MAVKSITFQLGTHNPEEFDAVPGDIIGTAASGFFPQVPFGMLPTTRGSYELEIGATNVGTALGTYILSAASVLKLDDTQRVFGATVTNLYEFNGTLWTAVSRATAYSSASWSSPWHFAQFENATYAAQAGNQLQRSTATGAFADVPNGPKAAFVETVNQFVVVANTATSTSQWICSALGDPQDWTPSQTTQCATGQITSVAGPITGLRKLGDNIVIYKERGIFLGRYAGAANNTFVFDQVPGAIGCVSNKSIVDIGYAHLFMGHDSFYIFDGTRPLPILSTLNAWFFQDKLSRGYENTVQGYHDISNRRVFWIYPVTPAILPHGCICFNYESNKWSAPRYGGTITGPFFTYKASNNVEYVGRVDSQGQLKSYETYSSNTGSFSIMLWNDHKQFITPLEVRPHWIKQPTNNVLGYQYYKTSVNGTWTQATTTQSTDFFQFTGESAKWIAYFIQINPVSGASDKAEFKNITFTYSEDGEE